MRSQPFADNRVSYGPQVFPSTSEEQRLEGPLRLGNQPPARARRRRSLRLRLSERYGVPFNSVQCNWHDGSSGSRRTATPTGW